MMQEYSEAEGKLIGEPKMLWRGSSSRTTEGPALYYKDGWYYLFCAEGGTGVRHCEVVLRSRHIDGPYERGPYEPLITAWPYPANPLQKAGQHGAGGGRQLVFGTSLWPPRGAGQGLYPWARNCDSTA